MDYMVSNLLWHTLRHLGMCIFSKSTRDLRKIQPKEGYEHCELQSTVELSAAALADLLYSHHGQPHSRQVSADTQRGMGWM